MLTIHIPLCPFHIIRAQGKVDLVDAVRGCKLSQRVNEDRHAIEREKLLGHCSAHSYTDPCGGDDGEDTHNETELRSET